MGWLESFIIHLKVVKRSLPPSIILLGGISLLQLFGCNKDIPEKETLQVDKTVLVYISANNDLKYSALTSIDQMESAYLTKFGNLLIFLKTDRHKSHILRIKSDHEKGVVNSDTLKSYNNENASDPIFMKTVLEDMKMLSPSKEYSLVLWSHGTSWLPNVEKIKTKSIGYDRGIETDISDLKTVIPNNLSYILFDACYMSSIEVIYELKDKTNYVIASNAEVLNTSFPYDKIVPYLFGEIDDLMQVCKLYYEFYDNKKELERSCTISLVDTKELDQLAKTTREIMDNYKYLDMNRNVQDFNFLKDIPIEFFDYQHLIEKNFSKAESDKISTTLKKCVLYKASTPSFLNSPIRNFSGLSISIPIEYKYQSFYKTLSWYKNGNVKFF